MVASFVDETYEIPVSQGNGGRYLKFQKGVPCKFRVVSERALKGWVYWNQQNKPVRVPFDPALPNQGKPINPPDAKLDTSGKPDRVRHFWAMVVWDYASEQICILEITQMTIIEQLLDMIRDADWGHPQGYDLKVTRTGEGLETKYSVMGNPNKSPIPEAAIIALDETPVSLGALLTGADPFAPCDSSDF